MRNILKSKKKARLTALLCPPFAAVLCLVFAISTVHATPLLPRNEWNEETKLRLTQAIIGEAGWKKRDDWELIPWVIWKRRRNRLRNGHQTTYLRVLQGYSMPVKPSLATIRHIRRAMFKKNWTEHRRALRRRFLQSILWDGSNLGELREAFQRPTPLDEMQKGWFEARALVEAWGRGEIPDKCPRALHWGHPEPRTDVIRVCKRLHTANYFYKNPNLIKKALKRGEKVVITTPSKAVSF